jgi:putative nucleotidyltransferase with HDIG domain
LKHKKKRSRARVVWKRWGDWRKIAVAVITALFVAALLTIPLLPDRVSVRPNQIATEDILAPRYLRRPDAAMTEYLRSVVAQQVGKVYSTVIGAPTSAREATVAFFDAVTAVRATPGEQPLAHRIALLRKRGVQLPDEVARLALALPPDQLSESGKAAATLVDQAMAEAIPPEKLAEARASMPERAAALPTLAKAPAAVRQLAAKAAAGCVLANRFYNEQETLAARQREMDQVPTQFETIRRGDRIVGKGERVTAEHWSKLQALGLVRERIDLWAALCRILLAFGLVATCCLYLYQFHPAVFRSFNSLLLIAVVVCGSLLLFRVASTALGLQVSGDQLGFIGMVCSALGAMLLAALLCPQIAVFIGVALALLTSVLVGAELKFAILSTVSSLVGVQAVTNIRNRAGILRACATVAVVNVITALIAQGATQATLSDEINTSAWWLMGYDAMWAGLGGVLSVALWMLFTAWLERPFRLTTHLTLLELSDPSHPLLRRLAMEAPGTYAHSIIVGNLSEACAEAIGADGMFCRVASYYHDIGKVIRPHFFVENQLHENRHNDISPSLSSLVVTSHVKDGVELAEEHRLPPPIINIIKEHHGTCLIKYFYHRALTSGEESTRGLEYQFRYEGPRPQTKESGIIMLADSSEAASRALEKVTPSRIRDLIERIVRDRLQDGQLDECELTFKDLEKIVSSMTRSLTSLLHARVEYPAGDTTDLKRLAADGAAHKEPAGVQKAVADTPETAAGAYGRPAGF